jgi:hypothetical protein
MYPTAEVSSVRRRRMSTHPGGASSAWRAIRLERWDFTFVATLAPERDATGAIRELSPQGRYPKLAAVPLHQHGHGTFCSFRIAVSPGLTGVYALVVDGSVRYIGECEDLGKRFNMGYGNISPKNCYRGGQPTNCKINRCVLDVSKAGGSVNLYFHLTTDRKTVEKQLISRYTPPWNG